MTPQYERDLADRLADFLVRWVDADLRSYLAEHSRLPGPRANLELAEAFARAVTLLPKEEKAMWTLCLRWVGLPPDDAPTDDPREFVVFCGVRAMGALGAASPGRAREALVHLRALARDSRWRVRKAVAMAIQDLAVAEPAATVRTLERWVAPGAWLEMRAVAAGLAEPRVLKERKVAVAAIRIHEDILRRFRSTEDRESAAFRSLRKCLAYSVSVVVAAAPEEGFRWITRLAATKDDDVVWILRENLKKSRLVAVFPARVQQLQAVLRHR